MSEPQEPIRPEAIESALIVEDARASQMMAILGLGEAVPYSVVATLEQALRVLVDDMYQLLILDNDFPAQPEETILEGAGQKLIIALQDPQEAQKLLADYAPDLVGRTLNTPLCIVFNSAKAREELRQALLPLREKGVDVHLVRAKGDIARLLKTLLAGQSTERLEHDLSRPIEEPIGA